jgi:chromosome segregation ATPase
MTKTRLVYIALIAAAIIIVASFISEMRTNHKIRKLEDQVETAKAASAAKARAAELKELESAQYKQKAEYLETNLAEIQKLARRQDENLEKLKNNSAAARSDVERSRQLGTIDSTADELCATLAELAHPCR